MSDEVDGIKLATMGPLGLLPAWAIGVLFLGLGGWLGYGRLPYLTKAVRCDGIVVDVEERPTARQGRLSTAYYPVVAYACDNQKHTFRSDTSFGGDSYEVGDTVSVLVVPGRPDTATLATFSAIWLAPLLCFGFGLLVTIVAILSVIFSGTRKRTSTDQLYKEAQYLWNVQRAST